MIQKAIQIAKRSCQSSYLTGAVITKNGKVISTGWSHLPAIRYTQLRSVHAEIHAVIRGARKDLAGSECWVANISRRSGNVTSAKPCETCASLMKNVGIRKVHFTTKTGIETIDLRGSVSGLKSYVGVGL